MNISEKRRNATKYLNEAQREQVLRQWDVMCIESPYTTNIELTPFGDVLEGFVVHPKVWQADKTSARYHASFLFFNNERLIRGRRVLDVGTGTGIQGITAAISGAASVVCTDISPHAICNARQNVDHYQLGHMVELVQGDLFDTVQGEFDLIVFMLPYFQGDAKQDPIGRSMLDDGELIARFLIDASKFLSASGVILMPSYSLAGTTNDPSIHGPHYGFDVSTAFSLTTSFGLQPGVIKLHELTKTAQK